MDRFKNNNQLLMFSIFIFLVLQTIIVAECTCDKEDEELDKAKALRYKIGALVSIPVASATGVSIPLLGKVISALSFSTIKANWGVTLSLSTGFIHVLPNAFESHLISIHGVH
ncbi:Zinc transporter 5 [Spatholobus suberectus]|nr:Zinc transporter 5 [Spatholobus suberectus]